MSGVGSKCIPLRLRQKKRKHNVKGAGLFRLLRKKIRKSQSVRTNRLPEITGGKEAARGKGNGDSRVTVQGEGIKRRRQTKFNKIGSKGRIGPALNKLV